MRTRIEVEQELGIAIKKSVDELTNITGMMVTGIDIQFIDASNVSKNKQVVSDVHVNYKS